MAKRPVFIGSTGIRLANVINDFQEAIELLGIPVVTEWSHDAFITSFLKKMILILPTQELHL